MVGYVSLIANAVEQNKHMFFIMFYVHANQGIYNLFKHTRTHIYIRIGHYFVFSLYLVCIKKYKYSLRKTNFDMIILY